MMIDRNVIRGFCLAAALICLMYAIFCVIQLAKLNGWVF